LSPFQIFYATEARAYELVMFFCVLAALLVVVAIERGGLGWWVAYCVTVAAAAYTHYTSVFVLVVVAGWALLAHPEARLRVILANLGAAVLYIPWIPELIDDRHEPAAAAIALLHPQTVSAASNDLVHWSIGHPYIPISSLPGFHAVWLMGVAVALGVIGLFLRWRGRAEPPWWPQRWGPLLVLGLALAAPVGAAIQGLIGTDVFSSRNILSSWPGLALLAGTLVAAGARPWRYAASGLLISAFTVGAVKMLSADNQRPDYDAAAKYVEETGPPGAPVVDTLGLTPGAQTAAEAAFAPKGEAYPEGREVLTLDFPTLQERLRVRKLGLSIIAPEPKPSPMQLARRAVQQAGASGTIFLISGGGSLEQFRSYPGPLAEFLDDLPADYHLVAYRDFPSLAYSGIRVNVLKPGPAAPLKPRT
jgi:hypothetical protein